MKKRGRAFGTNFHSVYGSDPEIYHNFSAAEHFSSQLRRRIKNLLRPGTLLDIACGTCHKTNLYSKYFRTVYALDYSTPLLEYAKQQYQKNKKIHYIWSSAARIPLLDNSVDTILVTWGSFPLLKSLREMKRVLKPDGYIIRIGACVEDEFTTLFPSFDIKRLNRINKTFTSRGFIIEHHEVTIRFNNLKEAREILTEIVGVPKGRIDKISFKHKVAFCYYRKA